MSVGRVERMVATGERLAFYRDKLDFRDVFLLTLEVNYTN